MITSTSENGKIPNVAGSEDVRPVPSRRSVLGLVISGILRPAAACSGVEAPGGDIG